MEAYEQLVAEGYLRSRPRSGTVVGETVTAIASNPSRIRANAHPVRPATRNPRPGRLPDCVLATGDEPCADSNRRPSLLTYPDPHGWWPLRVELAGYLRRVRGVDTAANRVVICSSAANAPVAAQRCPRRARRRHRGDRGSGHGRSRAGDQSSRRPVATAGRRRRRTPHRPAADLESWPRCWSRPPTSSPPAAALSLDRRAEPRSLGRLGWPGDRGRLRRRVPLRPGTRRGPPGSGPGPGGLHRHDEQVPGARAAAGLAGAAGTTRRPGRPGQAADRRGHLHAAASDLRRLPRPRRLRPPSAEHAAPLPSTPGRAARRARATPPFAARRWRRRRAPPHPRTAGRHRLASAPCPPCRSGRWRSGAPTTSGPDRSTAAIRLVLGYGNLDSSAVDEAVFQLALGLARIGIRS